MSITAPPLILYIKFVRTIMTPVKVKVVIVVIDVVLLVPPDTETKQNNACISYTVNIGTSK